METLWQTKGSRYLQVYLIEHVMAYIWLHRDVMFTSRINNRQYKKNNIVNRSVGSNPTTDTMYYIGQQQAVSFGG